MNKRDPINLPSHLIPQDTVSFYQKELHSRKVATGVPEDVARDYAAWTMDRGITPDRAFTRNYWELWNAEVGRTAGYAKDAEGNPPPPRPSEDDVASGYTRTVEKNRETRSEAVIQAAHFNSIRASAEAAARPGAVLESSLLNSAVTPQEKFLRSRKWMVEFNLQSQSTRSMVDVATGRRGSKDLRSYAMPESYDRARDGAAFSMLYDIGTSSGGLGSDAKGGLSGSYYGVSPDSLSRVSRMLSSTPDGRAALIGVKRKMDDAKARFDADSASATTVSGYIQAAKDAYGPLFPMVAGEVLSGIPQAVLDSQRAINDEAIKRRDSVLRIAEEKQKNIDKASIEAAAREGEIRGNIDISKAIISAWKESGGILTGREPLQKTDGTIEWRDVGEDSIRAARLAQLVSSGVQAYDINNQGSIDAAVEAGHLDRATADAFKNAPEPAPAEVEEDSASLVEAGRIEREAAQLADAVIGGASYEEKEDAAIESMRSSGALTGDDVSTRNALRAAYRDELENRIENSLSVATSDGRAKLAAADARLAERAKALDASIKDNGAIGAAALSILDDGTATQSEVDGFIASFASSNLDIPPSVVDQFFALSRSGQNVELLMPNMSGVITKIRAELEGRIGAVASSRHIETAKKIDDYNHAVRSMTEVEKSAVLQIASANGLLSGPGGGTSIGTADIPGLARAYEMYKTDLTVSDGQGTVGVFVRKEQADVARKLVSSVGAAKAGPILRELYPVDPATGLMGVRPSPEHVILEHVINGGFDSVFAADRSPTAGGLAASPNPVKIGDREFLFTSKIHKQYQDAVLAWSGREPIPTRQGGYAEPRYNPKNHLPAVFGVANRPELNEMWRSALESGNIELAQIAFSTAVAAADVAAGNAVSEATVQLVTKPELEGYFEYDKSRAEYVATRQLDDMVARVEALTILPNGLLSDPGALDEARVLADGLEVVAKSIDTANAAYGGVNATFKPVNAARVAADRLNAAYSTFLSWRTAESKKPPPPTAYFR